MTTAVAPTSAPPLHPPPSPSFKRLPPLSSLSTSSSSSDSTDAVPKGRRAGASQGADAGPSATAEAVEELEGEEGSHERQRQKWEQAPAPLADSSPSRAASGEGQAAPASAATTTVETSRMNQLPDRSFLISYFIAGGAAGATSRTVVSPLERLKIIMQVQPPPKRFSPMVGHPAAPSTRPKQAYQGVLSGLIKIYREEGFMGFMRGNGINCLRIIPYSAVQFSSYEILKVLLRPSDGAELDTGRRLMAGALAGISSVVCTYPLDLVRSRLSIMSASLFLEAQQGTVSSLSTAPSFSSALAAGTKPDAPVSLSAEASRAARREAEKKLPGMWAMTVQVYREEGGIRALYRGIGPTSAGVAPYVAINFAAYEAFRKRLTPPGESSPGTIRKLVCGALAGSISQTLTYPLDVLRRKMQVIGMGASKLGYSYNNSFDAVRNIVRVEGWRGMYRGLLPNLLKVAPSIGTSFVTYEWVRGLLAPSA